MSSGGPCPVEETYGIKQIAEFLEIERSTLRYWESEGLFASRRNRGNSYREFSFDLLLDIVDIVFYRGLGVPVKRLRNAREMTAEDIRSILGAAMIETEETLVGLRHKREAIASRLARLDELERLRNAQYAEGRPDFQKAVAWDRSDYVHWRRYLTAPPENIVLYADAEDPGNYKNGLLADNTGDESVGETLLWEEAKTGVRYFECLVRISCERREGADIKRHIEALSGMGYRPRGVLARYLVNTYDGEPWENYRAWVEADA